MEIGKRYKVTGGPHAGKLGVLVSIKDETEIDVDGDGATDYYFYKYYLDFDGNPDDAQGVEPRYLEAVDE